MKEALTSWLQDPGKGGDLLRLRLEFCSRSETWLACVADCVYSLQWNWTFYTHVLCHVPSFICCRLFKVRMFWSIAPFTPNWTFTPSLPNPSMRVPSPLNSYHKCSSFWITEDSLCECFLFSRHPWLLSCSTSFTGHALRLHFQKSWEDFIVKFWRIKRCPGSQSQFPAPQLSLPVQGPEYLAKPPD